MCSPFEDRTTADKGLHILKDKCQQKTNLGKQSAYLADEGRLEAAINATLAASPSRENYCLNRDILTLQDMTETQRERIWEQAIFQRWHFGQTPVKPVQGCWDCLIGYQVPLFEKQTKRGWGYIDLLGLQGNGTPVVIELKKEPKAQENGITASSESPLRMLLEAAAYAVSLRNNWEVFYNELNCMEAKLKKAGQGFPKKIPKTVKKIQLIGAAPASYWLDWLPVTEKGSSKPLAKETWKSFSKLLDAFKNQGFPVAFVSLSGDPSNPQQLAAQPLSKFPHCCCTQE